MKKNETKETTEQQILDAAKTVFQAKGMDGARMQEIADAAGINKAMLHYYYRSKEMLFEAVFKALSISKILLPCGSNSISASFNKSLTQ